VLAATDFATDDAARARVVELEAALVVERARAAALTAERDRFREGYQKLQIELELMRRRLFVAKAERIDTAQLELEFAGKLAALDALARQIDPTAAVIDEPPPPAAGEGTPTGTGGTGARRKRTSTGRRNLREEDLPEERIEVLDPDGERPDGAAARMKWEESCQIHWRRGGYVRVIIARSKYRDVEAPVADESSADGVAPIATNAPTIAAMPTFYTTPMPPMILPRSICTPSLIAHIVTDKFCYGLPLYRQEERSARLGFRIDRGSMCRWIEQVGATAGATVINAMRDEALRTAFCIATDATGILIQPIKEKPGDQARRGCRRGHFFVQIADADHVFFEFTPRETSAAVGELFKGFSGYVQADAKSVYDLLFKPPGERPPPDDGEPDLAERHEVGCWSHARRRVWETAITTKDPVAREGLLRIKRIFDLDRSWRGRPPAEIKALRDRQLRPHTDAFFAWVAEEYERVKDQRGMLRSALGYAHRQRGPLTRFFDDGRLEMTNNHSERQLRRVAVGRKAWLFVGSDDHAQAAGNLLSLIASARLHGLDPEAYLRDLFRVLPQWPRDRYLELAPRYWLATRERLDPKQLELEVGWLTVPPPLPTTEHSAAR
jgi:transposase